MDPDQSNDTWRVLRAFLTRNRDALWVIATLLVIEFVYVWFITAGTLTVWHRAGTYYDWLADAFRAGQIHVLQEPNPRLLTKEDPYDPVHARLWFSDLSLWKGKYYLYWGPVPAAIQAIGKSLLSINEGMGTQYLNFLFASIAGISGALLVFRVSTRLLSGVPRPVVCLSMLAIAFQNPILHSLCNGNVYLVAIMGASAFLVLGFLLALEALLASTARWKLAFCFSASLSWGLAMGCRASVAPPVIVAAFALGLLAQPLRTTPWRQTIKSLASALGPAGVAGLLLLYYNWLRFDNILEFDTGVQTTPWPYDFDLKHFPANLYTYFLRPPAISCHFPYFFQEWTPSASEFPAFIPLHEEFLFMEPVVGLIIAVPTLFFAFISLAKLKSLREESKRRAYLYCLAAFLAAGTLSGIAPMGFYFSTMRYQMDIVWGAGLLAALGFSFVWSQGRSWGYRLLAWLGVPLMLATIAFGFALGYQSYNGHVHHLNPKLDQSLRGALSVCPEEAPKFPKFTPTGRTNED